MTVLQTISRDLQNSDIADSTKLRLWLLSLLNQSEKYALVNGEILSKSLYLVRYGSLQCACEELLLHANKEMHFTEMAKHIREIRGKKEFSDRSAHAKLTFAKNAILVGRGTFKHRNCLIYNAEVLVELLPEIRNFLFASSFPCVSINRFFETRKEELSLNGIVSDYQLYFLLKEQESNLVFPKYPFIYLESNYFQRVLLTDIIEDFFYQTPTPLSKTEINENIVKALGLKEFQFSVVKSHIPQIIWTSSTHQTHIRHFHYDNMRLVEIGKYLENELAREGHLSIEKVFRDKIVLCKSAGFSNPYPLYFVLKFLQATKQANFKIQFTDYPHIASNKTENDFIGPRKAVERFILDFRKPCPITEILKHFKGKKGYKEANISNTVFYVREIIRYDPKSWIHISLIGWNLDRQQELIRIAGVEIGKIVEAGRLFGRLSYILEEIVNNIPLENGILWTQTLAYELLKMSKEFIFLGSGKEAVLPNPNKYGIATFIDLIANILLKEFQGAARFAQFEEYLQRERIIHSRLTDFMLKDQDQVFVKGNEIFHAKLLKYA